MEYNIHIINIISGGHNSAATTNTRKNSSNKIRIKNEVITIIYISKYT